MIKIHSICSMILFCFIFQGVYGQQRFVINNDAYVVIDGNGVLVIENPNANALTLTGTGGNVISESELDVIKWNIGTNIGNYVIPYTTTLGNKIPYSFNIQSAGSGPGYYLFSTFNTSSTNLPLPTGVATINNPLSVTDRFWIMKPFGYTASPGGMMELAYSAIENGGSNTIVASDLEAEGYNTSTNTWSCLSGVNNSGLNKVSSIPIVSGVSNTVWTLQTKLQLASSKTDVSCFMGSNGTATAIASGGAGSYTYSWTPNIGNTAMVSGLLAGTYNVTVTDANGCTLTTSATLTQPSAGIDLTESHVNVGCFGASTGSIDLSVSGGTLPYSYSWSNTSTTQDIIGLASGNYTVSVLDGLGCTSTLPVTITQPTSALALTNTQVNVGCFGASTGSIDLSVTGGTAPYAYAWSNGSTAQDATSLAAGTYDVTVTDANGCTATTSATLTQPSSALALNESHVNVGCFGASTGSIDLSVTGGTASYTYAWSNGSTTQDLGSLAAGTYSVTVTDTNGCTSTTSATLTQPSASIALTETHVNVGCFGASTGSIDLSVTGGTTPYTYSWSNTATTQDIIGLASGTYTVSVLDGLGCTSTLPVTITQPSAALALTSTQVNVGCFGASTGSIDLSVTGGTAPYAYAWSNGSTSQDATSLAAGTYNVTLTDANGCTATTSATLTQPATGPNIIETHVNVSCFGDNNGSISLSQSGGVAPFLYSWPTLGVTGSTVSNLSDGNYLAILSDAIGCTDSINVQIQEPLQIIVTETITNSDCDSNNGSIIVGATGGVGSYAYSWNPIGPTTNFIFNLASGNYSVTVTDTNGCSISENYNVALSSGPSIQITPNSADIIEGDSIQLNVTGGLNYNWSPATGLDCVTCSNPTASPTTTTTYIVSSTGLNGCMTYDSLTIYVTPVCGEIYVPNIFSPNEIGLEANNSFCVYGNCIVDLTIMIFNRWGEKVYESVGVDKCWDGFYKGTPLNPGVFVYMLNATLFDGSTITKSGNVTLVR